MREALKIECLELSALTNGNRRMEKVSTKASERDQRVESKLDQLVMSNTYKY